MTTPRAMMPADDVKSSITAISVGMGFARAIYTGNDYIFDRKEADLTSHLCVVASRSLRGTLWAVNGVLASLPYTLQQAFFNCAVIPGYDNVLMLRKLMIRQKIDLAIKNGAKQVVFLGGGYDIRGLMTALAYPDINVFEIDRGPTRACKLAGLRSIPRGIGFDHVVISDESNCPGLAIANGNMHYINVDLNFMDLADVLRQYGYQNNRQTLFVAEGLTMYLSEEANSRLLGAVSRLLQLQDELIISYGTKSMHSKVSKAAQSASNELYRFFMPMNCVIDFAGQFGFDVAQRFSATDALRLIGDPNAKYYTSYADRPCEYYVSLIKQPAVYGKTIESVPLVNLDIPAKPMIESSSRYCQIQ